MLVDDVMAAAGELGALSEAEAVARIQSRYTEVCDRIQAHCGGRPVEVVAMTKGFGPRLVELAVQAGLTTLGENYAQELVSKATDPELASYHSEINWHFVGGLQRNKIKKLVGLVDVWESIDRLDLIDELAKRDPGARLLLQVNTTDEPQKSGCTPQDLPTLLERADERGLAVEGLMTVGPTDPAIDARPSFVRLRELAQRHELAQLSMGMSGDYDIAVAEGATIVRVGSVLFGARPIRG